MFQAVLWDMDGTLVRSDASILAAANAALRSAGLPPFGSAEMLPLIGTPIRRIFELRTDDGKTLDQLVKGYRHSYAEDAWRLSTLYPGVRDLLESIASRGIPNAIVTTKGEAAADALLGQLAIRDLFKTVVGDDGRRPLKPDPASVRDACLRLAVSPQDAVMVGDTEHDFQAARGAGVPFIGVTWGYGRPPRTGSVGLFGNMEEVARAIGVQGHR